MIAKFYDVNLPPSWSFTTTPLLLYLLSLNHENFELLYPFNVFALEVYNIIY